MACGGCSRQWTVTGSAARSRSIWRTSSTIPKSSKPANAAAGTTCATESTTTQYLWGYGEEEERAYISDCVDTFRRLTGRRLHGWFSPAASHTLNTPDLVAAAGFSYYCDFYHDDQPIPVRVKTRRLITIPYQMDLNDAVLTQGSGEGEDFLRISRDMFDTLYAEGETNGRVMCMAIHPYLMGRPHRHKYLAEAIEYIVSHSGVWLATGSEIADWYYAHYRERGFGSEGLKCRAAAKWAWITTSMSIRASTRDHSFVCHAVRELHSSFFFISSTEN